MNTDKLYKEIEFYRPYKQYNPSRLKKHNKRCAMVAHFIYQWWHAGNRPVTIVKPRSIKNEMMNISGVCLYPYICAN